MNSTKTCYTCQHFYPMDVPFHDLCCRKKSMGLYLYAEKERRRGECGPEGKFWMKSSKPYKEIKPKNDFAAFLVCLIFLSVAAIICLIFWLLN